MIMDNYSSLIDCNLARYFDNDRIQRHLYKSCLINRDGDILTQKSYGVMNGRLEQKEHAERTRAPVTAAQLLTYERNGRKRAELVVKLEQLVALENVRRVREETRQKQKQKPLPRVVFDPVDSPHGTPRSSRGKDTSNNGFHGGHHSSDGGGRGDSHDGIVHHGDRGDDIDGTGNNRGKNTERLLPQRHSQDKRQVGKIDAALSPLSQQQKQRQHKTTKHSKSKTDKKRCYVTLHYFGRSSSQPLNAGPKQSDGDGDEICIKQQISERSTRVVFKERVKPGSHLKFLSHRTVGHPFSVSIFINGSLDSRLSACCESKYSNSSRLGAREGHFAFIRARNATPCLRCQANEQANNKADRSNKKQAPNQPKEDNNDDNNEPDDSSSESDSDSGTQSSVSSSPESHSRTSRHSSSDDSSSSSESQCPHHPKPLVNVESDAIKKSKNRSSVVTVHGRRYTVTVNTEKGQAPDHRAGVNNRKGEHEIEEQNPGKHRHRGRKHDRSHSSDHKHKDDTAAVDISNGKEETRHRKKGDDDVKLNIAVSVDQDGKIKKHKINGHVGPRKHQQHAAGHGDDDDAAHSDGTPCGHKRQHRDLDRRHRDADERDRKNRRHRHSDSDSDETDFGRKQKRSSDGTDHRPRRHRHQSDDSEDRTRSRSESTNSADYCYKDFENLDHKLEEKSRALIKILDRKIQLLEQQFERREHVRANYRSKERSPSGGSRSPSGGPSSPSGGSRRHEPMGNKNRDHIVNSSLHPDRRKNPDQILGHQSTRSTVGSQLDRPARPEPREKSDLDPSNNSSRRSSNDKNSGVRSRDNVSSSRSRESSLFEESIRGRRELKENKNSYRDVDSSPRSDRSKRPDFRGGGDRASTPRRLERDNKLQDAVTSDRDEPKTSDFGRDGKKKSAPQSPALSLDGKRGSLQKSKDQLELPGAKEKESDTDHSFWSDVSRDEVKIPVDSGKHLSSNKAGEDRDYRAGEIQQLSSVQRESDPQLHLSLEKGKETSSEQEKHRSTDRGSLDRDEAKHENVSSRSSSSSSSSDESVKNNISKYQEVLQRREESLSGSKHDDEQPESDGMGHGENVDDEDKEDNKDPADRDKVSVGSHASRVQRGSGDAGLELLEDRRVESPRTLQPPQPLQRSVFNPTELDESSSVIVSEDEQSSEEELQLPQPHPRGNQAPAADNSDDDF